MSQLCFKDFQWKGDGKLVVKANSILVYSDMNSFLPEDVMKV